MNRCLAVSHPDILSFFDRHPSLNFEDVVQASLPEWESRYASLEVAANEELGSVPVIDFTELYSKFDHLEGKYDSLRESDGVRFNAMVGDFLEKLKAIISQSRTDSSASTESQFTLAIEKAMVSMKELCFQNRNDSSVDAKLSLMQNVVEDMKTTINQMRLQQNELSKQEVSTSMHVLKLQSDICDSIKKQEVSNTELQKITSKFQNSSSKGSMSENMLSDLLYSAYPSASIIQTGQSKQSHMGDILFQQQGMAKILIENKCYDQKNVPTDEVNKFMSDCKLQQCSGIMISQHSGISLKRNFDIECNYDTGDVYVYLHRVFNDITPVNAAIHIIENLSALLRSNTSGNSINKEKLKVLKDAYERFTEKHRELLKVKKDHYDREIQLLKTLQLTELSDFFSFYNFSKEAAQTVSSLQKRKQSDSLVTEGSAAAANGMKKQTKLMDAMKRECPRCNQSFSRTSAHFRECAKKGDMSGVTVS